MKKMLLIILSFIFLNACITDRYYKCKINNDFKPKGNSITIISQSDDKIDILLRDRMAELFDNYSTLKAKITSKSKVNPPFTSTDTDVVENLNSVDAKSVEALSEKYKTDYIMILWLSPVMTENFYKNSDSKIHFSNSSKVYYQLIGNPGNILISSGYNVITWYEKHENMDTVEVQAVGTKKKSKEFSNDTTAYSLEAAIPQSGGWLIQSLADKLDVLRPK